MRIDDHTISLCNRLKRSGFYGTSNASYANANVPNAYVSNASYVSDGSHNDGLPQIAQSV